MKPAPAPTPSAPPAPFEVWTLLAYVIGALFAGLLVYLGLRPGGMGPIYAWGVGRDLVNLCALAMLCTGAIWSFLHRPVFRPGRRLPFLILVLVVGIGAYPIPYPTSHEGHPSTICFRLPFEGEWTVFWGGEKKEDNLLAVYTADRRFGLDFVVAGEEATGKDVLAPADGVVVAAVDGLPDLDPGVIDRKVEPSGNRVVIQVADRQFVFLCHLQKDSIRVETGQEVKAGDPIGRAGTSGWSKVTPRPHLAIHLQDTAVPGKGEAIPWHFCDYTADGVRVEKGVPTGGIGPGGALRGQKVAPSPR